MTETRDYKNLYETTQNIPPPTPPNKLLKKSGCYGWIISACLYLTRLLLINLLWPGQSWVSGSVIIKVAATTISRRIKASVSEANDNSWLRKSSISECNLSLADPSWQQKLIEQYFQKKKLLGPLLRRSFGMKLLSESYRPPFLAVHDKGQNSN